MKKNKLKINFMVYLIILLIGITPVTDQSAILKIIPEFETESYIFVGTTFPFELEYMVQLYSEYFHVEAVDHLNYKYVETLIIFAHGSNNGESIFLEKSPGVSYKLRNLNAAKVIYISCSVGIIEQIDLDTEHYSYSITDELDQYESSYVPDGGEWIDIEIDGWGMYFLDLIKSGMNWEQAELVARNMTNEYFNFSKI